MRKWIKDLLSFVNKEPPANPGEDLRNVTKVVKAFIELSELGPKETFLKDIDFVLKREKLFDLNTLIDIIETLCKQTKETAITKD
jgi:hypothetical protein